LYLDLRNRLCGYVEVLLYFDSSQVFTISCMKKGPGGGGKRFPYTWIIEVIMCTKPVQDQDWGKNWLALNLVIFEQ
jgi:hypothetical protein